METEAIERIRRAYELFNRTGGIETEFFHPDAEWCNAPEMPGATVYRGRDAMAARFAERDDAWQSRRSEPVEIIPAGENVVVFVEMAAKGKTSGVAIRTELTHVWTLENGLVRRVQVFMDREAALQAAGIA